jgi:hypothetical protein
MSANTSTELTALGIEPTFSAREAAVLLGRSYSWLDQRVRSDEFVLPEGSVVQPLRTPGGYRRFTLEMLKDIALSSYRHGWFSTNKLRSRFVSLPGRCRCPVRARSCAPSPSATTGPKNTARTPPRTADPASRARMHHTCKAATGTHSSSGYRNLTLRLWQRRPYPFRPGNSRGIPRPPRTPRTGSHHRRVRIQSPHRVGVPATRHRHHPPSRGPRRPDLRIARPQGRDDDHRRHGDLRIRPNRPGPNRTGRGLEIDHICDTRRPASRASNFPGRGVSEVRIRNTCLILSI